MHLSLPITIACLLLATAFLGAQDYRRAAVLSHREEPRGGVQTGAAPSSFNPLDNEDRAMRPRKTAWALHPEAGGSLPGL